METYKQNCKNRVRNEALTYAIRALTSKRFSSTIAEPMQLLNIANCVEREFLDTNIMLGLKEETIQRWGQFYKAIVGVKKRSELKIAYLCGPEPENDLNIMLKNGVLPENIWAFESDNPSFECAKQKILSSKFPYLKIVKRDIKFFFQTSSIVFDIIYLDFCSTLLKNENIDVLTTLFNYHVLSPLGVVITNFSFSNKDEDLKTYEKIQSFVSNYLFHKSFLESEYRQTGEITEGPISSGFSCPECNDKCLTYVKNNAIQDSCDPFLARVKQKTEEYYGQCITRFLMDLPSTIIPAQRLFVSDNTLKNIFGNKNELQNCFNKYIKDYLPDENKPSLEKFYSFLCDNEDWPGKIMFDLSKKSGDMFSAFLKKINISNQNNQIEDMITNLFRFELLIYENSDNINERKTSFGDFCKKWRRVIKTEYSFCDVFMFHQIFEVLLAQITVPYFCKVDKTRRWTYKAKQHQMFTDLLIYDQARYIIDWLTTPEMISDLNFDLQIELSIRYLLDSFAKNNRYFLSHLFFGCNVVQFTSENSPVLLKRKHLLAK